MVWKKSDDQPNSYPEPVSAAPRPTPPAPLAAGPGPAPEPRRTGERATIGPSIIIKGDLSGGEDLVIEGRVEGKVDLKQHNVTVGKNGRVKADLYGKVVTIEGEVDGNVFAQEQAILRQSGAIRGNISAPRVILEDGSRFKGSIDMEAREAPRNTVSEMLSRPERPQPMEASRPQTGEPGGESRAAQAG